MLKFILTTIFLFLYSNSVLATECGIVFGGGGKNSSVIKLKNSRTTKINDIGGPWSFIRKTYGPCSFMLYNKNNFKGKKVNYGSSMGSTYRVAARDGNNKGGWKVRSVKITQHKNVCKIKLKAISKGSMLGTVRSNRTQVFYGPSRISNISAWSVISSVSAGKNCSYTIYNGTDYDGRFIKVKKLKKGLRPGWRIRSIEINQ